MNRTIRRTLLAVALFASGLTLGVVGTTRFVLNRGERAGARLIQWGVLLSNAGNPDLAWDVRVRTEPPPPAPTPPVVRVAQKGKP